MISVTGYENLDTWNKTPRRNHWEQQGSKEIYGYDIFAAGGFVKGPAYENSPESLKPCTHCSGTLERVDELAFGAIPCTRSMYQVTKLLR